MKKSLLGLKVALLIANGFAQDDMVAAQKALIAAGANVRVVSPENGLVNGWDGESWGHHFAVDAPLHAALAADYSILVIPGGQRSLEKLNLTAHTKRFISSFMDSEKPVVVMDNALHILIMTDHIKGRTVSGPEDMRDVVAQAGGKWREGSVCRDGFLMTGAIHPRRRDAFIDSLLDHCQTCIAAIKAA